MPPKNSIKLYVEDGYYHIYNRGVEKRIIFQEERDYKTLLFFLKNYLDPNEKINPITGLVNPMNLSDEVDLLAYCLMPNHFHFLIHQSTKDGMAKFMKRVATNYAMYFNWRYERVGPLFQGIYKAVLIESDEQLLHVTRYIHRNSDGLMRVDPSIGINPIAAYPYSSFGDYIGLRNTSWVKPQIILEYFSNPKTPISKRSLSYASFVYEKDMDNEEMNSFFIDSDDPQ